MTLWSNEEGFETLGQPKKLVNKFSVPTVWQVSLGNPEPAVATSAIILKIY
jgi:hypothetical protein